jgi:hypothetical protein
MFECVFFKKTSSHMRVHMCIHMLRRMSNNAIQNYVKNFTLKRHVHLKGRVVFIAIRVTRLGEFSAVAYFFLRLQK